MWWPSHRPSEARNVGTPLSAETPAPVSTHTRFAECSASAACSSGFVIIASPLYDRTGFVAERLCLLLGRRFRDHAHDRLRVAAAHVQPPVGAVDSKAILGV